MNLGFKMLYLRRMFGYNFKDGIFIHLFYDFYIIYPILYVDVTVGIYFLLFARKDILFI